jgi:heme/copper-type cytochrome/quinol oxidase subunit 3
MREKIGEYFATPARRRTAWWTLANLVVFTALLGVMFYMRWVSEAWPTPFHFPSLLMAAAMTMFATCASITVAIGASAAKLEDKEPAVRWIAIAIVSWLVFLFLETVEWVRLAYLEKLGPDTSFGWTFMMLTGSHWLAAALCAGWFTRVAVNVRERDPFAPALYSFFLSVWWVVLVFCLYLLNADMQGM